MIYVHSEDSLWIHLLGSADHGLDHSDASIGASTLGDLHDERGLGLDAPAEQPPRLLHVVDVVGADSVAAIGELEKLRRCY